MPKNKSKRASNASGIPKDIPPEASNVVSKDRVDLIRQRGALKAKLTRFLTFFDELKSNSESLNSTKLYELELRLKNMEGNILEQFSEIELKLEALDLDKYDASELDIFESSCFETFAEVNAFLMSFRTVQGPPTPPTNPSGAQFSKKIGIRYPDIKLPIFSGSYENWLEFKELYMSLIHNNPELEPIQKFHYLRASLEGSAAQCIQSIDLVNQNYSIAWDILCNRFDNKQLMVHKHIKNLFSIHEVKPDSSSSFRSIVDNITKNIRSLETLKLDTRSWDPMIIFLVTSKLDVDTLRDWERLHFQGDLPTLDELKAFLSNRADLLDKLNMHKSKFKPKNPINLSPKVLVSNEVDNRPEKTQTKFKVTCYCCKEAHSIFRCPEFLSLSIPKRLELIIQLKLCTNCFQKNHQAETCERGTCRICNQKHNSLLHSSIASYPVLQSSELCQEENIEDALQSEREQITTCCNHSPTTQVLLATVRVSIPDKFGNTHMCRALLDNGSMSNFICKRLVQKLGLRTEKIKLSVMGIGQNQENLSASCDIQINSLCSNFKTNLHCLVIPEITNNLPNAEFEPASLNIPPHITLSDPTFSIPNHIELLIGADTFWSLLQNDKIELGKTKPILQKTKLGWIISGPLNFKHTTSTSCNLSKTIDIQTQLAKFWELEQVSEKPLLSSEETSAEDHFVNTFKRSPEGRFIVSIPLKDSPGKLGDSKNLATKQFLALERNLNSKPKLRELYVDFINEFKELSHMSKFVPQADQITYFAPHHGVFREDSATTKLRVVFNCSAKSSSGYSYNDIQMVGPVVQDDLFSILIRFRQHRYVVSADISKMYRQIEISEEFKNLQLILWRNNPEDELQIYSLDRVAYGTASAPFLATRCLLQLAMDHEKTHPDAAKVIRNNIYVDDLLFGTESLDTLEKRCKEISTILKSGCFELRKWKANVPEILTCLSLEHKSTDPFFFATCETSKTLGMSWSCITDTFLFTIGPFSQTKRVTKRIILSDTAKIFDPLGLISPVIILAKVMLQALWLLKITWDEEVSPELSKRWISFRQELVHLNALTIRRHMSCKNPISIQIHGFADSSQNAYGAALYLRVMDSEGNIHVNLITSKTRVAPLKSVSIPRLELCAAKLLSELFNKVSSALTLNIENYCLWSDSTVTLAWIRTSPHLLQVFVGNRVNKIQELTDILKWHYVPTQSNPADILSRGMNPKELTNSTMWFFGPEWLKQPEEFWPEDISLTTPHSNHDLPELRQKSISLVQTQVRTLFPFERFSTLSRLKRVFAYVLRFINNCRRQTQQSSSLSIEELREAQLKLCQIAQCETFATELHDLSSTGQVRTNSKILQLNPFLYNNLIRVGGRLFHSSYPHDKKHPIILASNHHLTFLIFRQEHFRLLHCGPQMLLASVREQFWPVAGKNLAKKVVRECIVCFRCKPSSPLPIMGNLPGPRISQTLPFCHTGVDYAGPFHYKDRRGRGAKTHKCYISLFICLTVKAVHLELVTELSTAAFMEALQRFIARRGKPSVIYSDNGKNFVGANNKLQELGNFLKTNCQALQDTISNTHDIKWSFLPAYSPHQGGLWEAGVKSTKFHLTRTLGNSTLTFESFSTVITQIEGILNSRPLTQLSVDPNDLEALTPAHLLIGRSLQTVPYYDVKDIPLNRLTHYENLEALKQKFWSQWSTEYISQLQERTKWRTNRGSLAVGAMVVIKNEHLPPYMWRLGRVVMLHPGKDNVVRVVSIKTSNGIIKRATVNVCPLPLPIEQPDV